MAERNTRTDGTNPRPPWCHRPKYESFLKASSILPPDKQNLSIERTIPSPMSFISAMADFLLNTTFPY
ncbi:hypothetical protein AG1IA_08404 [Rhizoctonia solani AG-1 IA]|uniref:Uncharacterized protein n=1 Tax=Thanatephorus cucumeris (strain AG1-IA) TaxID=983506 RepID=L8WHW3_THACA|nr:hypothetical protein AG1IA_08404 [Rhizoctonia solani AG-1 IA]